MKKHILYILLFAGFFAAGFSACSDDIDPVVETLDLPRLLSPIDLEARVINRNSLRLSWDEVTGAEAYTVEVYTDSLIDGQEPESAAVVVMDGILPEDLPLEDILLEGETRYTARVQANSTQKASSKWSLAHFATDTEQNFYAVDPDELTATEVSLRWPANLEVTDIFISPGDINHPITADEKAAGAATITGLSGDTDYRAIMRNGDRIRGSISFRTLIDLGNATAIRPGDDIVQILTDAADGDEFVIFPGEYILGSFTLTKSLKLTGYLPQDRPVIRGAFTIDAAINSLELRQIIFDGSADAEAGISAQTTVFTVGGSCNLSTLTVVGCLMRDYGRSLISCGNNGVLGVVSFSDCIIRDFPGTGGDFIDFRNGGLTSLTVENSTFAVGTRSFVRLQGVQPTVAFRSCTFYKVMQEGPGNNTGMFRFSGGGGTLEVTRCLFADTGKPDYEGNTGGAGTFARRADHMQATSTNYSRNYFWNCYNMFGGLYSITEVSGTEADPGSENAAEYDLKVTNEDIIYYQVGDPRWLQ